MTRPNSRSKDSAWPPLGVHDLRPDEPTDTQPARVRFSTLRDALDRTSIDRAALPRKDANAASRRHPHPKIGEAQWTGPNANDLMPSGDKLCRPVPPERWPCGPPTAHEPCCRLHAQGLYCDCRASDASDLEWGIGA